MHALINYVFSNGITVTKTTTIKGFMIYTPSQVTDIETLRNLAESVSWKVLSSDDEWDKGTKVSSARIYVGPVTNSLDITDKQAMLDYLKSQDNK